MGQRIHALAQHLFGKTTVEECDLKEVQILANKYPYLAPAQILLLQKLKAENEEAYDSQLQKAILYYPNPLEFQLLVDEERFVVEESFERQTPSFGPESKEGADEYNVVEQGTEWQNENLQTGSGAEVDVYSEAEQTHEQQTANPETENDDDVQDYNIVEQNTEWQNEKLEIGSAAEVDVYSEPEQNHEQQTANPETENNHDVEDYNVVEQGTKWQNEKLETGSAAEVDVYSEPEQNHEQQTANPETESNDNVEEYNVAEQNTELQNEKLETVSDQEHNYQNHVEKNVDTKTDANYSGTESTPISERRNDQRSINDPEPLDIQTLSEGDNDFPQNLKHKTQNPELQTPNTKSQTNNSEEPLAFEPYHTIDYFASQGIKMSVNEMPKDKLGKQLKSFTEWLKTMKRLPATQAITTIDAASENKIEHMAAHSVDATNVFTEAMAEVWLKQGNTQKAIEVYNKLSLLYPAKRAFFAAKIENLKHL
ncbi:MAG: hypothetical protein V4676_02640 [Bacteroidota bacterium]